MTANHGSNNVSVLLGNGNGTFQTQSTLGVGGNPRSIVIGDFNGDGAQDISTTNFSSASVSVLIGNGNGTFGAQNTFAVGDSPIALALSDLNGDGVQDLVSSSVGDNSISILSARTKDGVQPLLPISLKTQADSKQALSIVSKKLELLSAQRGVIGASQSRLLTGSRALLSQRDEFLAANSRIRDADFSSEAAELARTQIIQNAAAAVMAQANQQPALALQLLRAS